MFAHVRAEDKIKRFIRPGQISAIADNRLVQVRIGFDAHVGVDAGDFRQATEIQQREDARPGPNVQYSRTSFQLPFSFYEVAILAL